jgi:hypothetical protein
MGSTIGFLLHDCCREHPEVVACCHKRAQSDPPDEG